MIRINKRKVLSLLTASLISLCHVSHASCEIKTEGDKVKAKVKVNMRVNNNLDSNIIGKLKENNIAKRIFSCDNGWSLIEYNGEIGFVKNEFVKDISDENIYCDINFLEIRKILLTNNYCQMHLDPFSESDVLESIPLNTIIDAMAYSSNNWYLVNYNNKLGFVDGIYLNDLNINNTMKVVTTDSEVNIRSRSSVNSEKYDVLYKGDYYPLIREDKDFYCIDYYGWEAYVSKKYAKVVEKDISVNDFIKHVYVKKTK